MGSLSGLSFDLRPVGVFLGGMKAHTPNRVVMNEWIALTGRGQQRSKGMESKLYVLYEGQTAAAPRQPRTCSGVT